MQKKRIEKLLFLIDELKAYESTLFEIKSIDWKSRLKILSKAINRTSKHMITYAEMTGQIQFNTHGHDLKVMAETLEDWSKIFPKNIYYQG